jgi:hypothetical protein
MPVFRISAATLRSISGPEHGEEPQSSAISIAKSSPRENILAPSMFTPLLARTNVAVEMMPGWSRPSRTSRITRRGLGRGRRRCRSAAIWRPDWWATACIFAMNWRPVILASVRSTVKKIEKSPWKTFSSRSRMLARMSETIEVTRETRPVTSRPIPLTT